METDAPSVIMTWPLSTVIESGLKISGNTATLAAATSMVRMNTKNKRSNKTIFFIINLLNIFSRQDTKKMPAGNSINIL
jgi:hypothetical protein